MISPNDNDFDLTVNILGQVDWKNLYKNMPTIIEKKNQNYNPENITIKDLKKKWNGKKKRNFLSRKHKRYEINENEKKNIPKNLNELINYYGYIQINVSQSLIEKYNLYKKYMKHIHREKIK